MMTLCGTQPPLQESWQLLLVSAVMFGWEQNKSTARRCASPGTENTCPSRRSPLFGLQVRTLSHPEEGCHLGSKHAPFSSSTNSLKDAKNK